MVDTDILCLYMDEDKEPSEPSLILRRDLIYQRIAFIDTGLLAGLSFS